VLLDVGRFSSTCIMMFAFSILLHKLCMPMLTIESEAVATNGQSESFFLQK
jgi:hypothetical protein